MKPAVKFIHTADLHLGSRIMINLNNSDIDENIYNAVYNSFKKIIDTAIDYSVDFVIISGDIFDNESRSVKATRFFINQCNRLEKENIDVYLINGNHDPYKNNGELFELPKNVYICDTEGVSTFNVYKNEKLIARVLGQSYRSSSENRKMYTYYTTDDQSVYNIGILHTQLDPYNDNYVPVTKNELLSNDNIDYWALGHIHDNKIINDEEPFIVYPGNPQGRDIGETGKKGFYLVHLDSTETKLQFIETSDYEYKRIKIDLSGIKESNLTEFNNYIADELENFYKNASNNIKGYILRVILVGRTKVYELLQEQENDILEDALENLRTKFSKKTPLLWINEIENRTNKAVENIEQLIKEDPFINDFIDFLNKFKTDQKKKNKLKNNMGNIWNSEVDNENIDSKEFQIDEQTFQELLSQVKKDIINEFIERREI
ncbi:MAG: DNA repair exonuclease [Halanaerobiales bacterium]|nr:DNA repair exonuclease [Halanaerobiales bacterium]